MRAAIGDIDVVVNALNLPYHQWDKGRMEAQNQRVIAAHGHQRQDAAVPRQYLQLRRHRPRGDARTCSSGRRRRAAKSGCGSRRCTRRRRKRGDIQAIILRAGDFYGPESTCDWFDLAMLREAKKGKFAMMGVPGVGHAWAYLPDLGRAFEKLAWHRKEFGAFENFHFAGNYVTPEQMAEAAVAAAPVKLKVGVFPRVPVQRDRPGRPADAGGQQDELPVGEPDGAQGCPARRHPRPGFRDAVR